MGSSKLLTVFDKDDRFKSTIAALSLDVSEAYFIYHHTTEEIHFSYVKRVIQRYKDIPLHFVEIFDDEKDIKEILAKDEDMIVDVGGEKYLSFLLFDMVLPLHNRLIYYDDEENVIKSYREHIVYVEKVFPLGIEDIINLGGGEISSHMHKAVDLDDNDTVNVIETVMRSSISTYSRFISFVQRINSVIARKDSKDGYTYRLSEEEKQRVLTDDAFMKYRDEGLLRIEGNKLIFHSRKIAHLFGVSGAFLENYLYIKLTRSGYFDDVMMSCVIDFTSESRKYPVVCEIDCLVIKDDHLLLVSCKSNKVEADDLNEIKVHDVMFGNSLSSPVLCTLDDLDKKSPSVYGKGRELQVAILDQTSFVNDSVAEDFLSVIDGTYTYEKLPE